MPQFRVGANGRIADAVQFDPHTHPWPAAVTPWPRHGATPRDMSWGYIENAYGLPRHDIQHVFAGDWIVTGPDGRYYAVDPEQFAVSYHPVG